MVFILFCSFREQVKIAMIVAKNKVSLNQAGKVAAEFLALPKPISRFAVTDYLFEISSLMKIFHAGMIVKSSDLGLMMDGTSDRSQRCPVAVRISGVSGGKSWSIPFGFREPLDHKAATQVALVLQLLDETNWVVEKTYPDPLKSVLTMCCRSVLITPGRILG